MATQFQNVTQTRAKYTTNQNYQDSKTALNSLRTSGLHGDSPGITIFSTVRLNAIHSLLYVWAQLFSLAAQSPAPGQERISGYPDPRASADGFKLYLQNPYPIKRVIYSRPASEVFFKGRPLNGRLFYEGSLQKHTFYLRHLTAPSNQPPEYVSYGSISGKSSNGIFWDINKEAAQGKGGEVHLIPESEFQSNTNSFPRNPTDALFAGATLERIANFGIFLLINDSIVWSGKSLTGKNWGPGWPQQRLQQPFQLEILEETNNLPTRIGLTSDMMPKEWKKVEIQARYDPLKPDRWFPTELSTILYKGEATNVVSRIQILEIEFGESESGRAGFTPEMFLTINSNTPPNVFLYTNNVCKWFDGFQFREMEQPSAKPKGSASWRRNSMWIAITGLISVVTLISVKRLKENKTEP